MEIFIVFVYFFPTFWGMVSLVIDTSTILHQVGILEGNQFTTFSSSGNDTLAGFFSILSTFLNNFHYSEIIFCEGPGKLLGIRSTLMFARIAKIIHPHIRIYSYSNLVFVDRIRNRLALPPGSLICVPRNNGQYYIFDGNQITLVRDEELRCHQKPIYCLSIHHRESSNHALIPMTYGLGNHADILRTIITPNEAAETPYYSQNEYKKWIPSRSLCPRKNA
ncbi:MAG: hypothetical protein LBD60_02280 [Puniceicoccales bacterium]|jgi:hypothetical protein|nr:hypothetical protein [Puniceicoccales bacterium]